MKMAHSCRHWGVWEATEPKEYFEFGSESGVEVNTRILRDLHGWTGHLLDGSQENPDIALHKRLETNWSALPGLEKAISDKESGVVSIYDYNYSDKTWQWDRADHIHHHTF